MDCMKWKAQSKWLLTCSSLSTLGGRRALQTGHCSTSGSGVGALGCRGCTATGWGCEGATGEGLVGTCGCWTNTQGWWCAPWGGIGGGRCHNGSIPRTGINLWPVDNNNLIIKTGLKLVFMTRHDVSAYFHIHCTDINRDKYCAKMTFAPQSECPNENWSKILPLPQVFCCNKHLKIRPTFVF